MQVQPETEEDLSSHTIYKEFDAADSQRSFQWTVTCSSFLKSIKRTSTRRFPIAGWLTKYDWKENGVADLVVGISMSFIIVPKALGHAALAQVSAVHGLYTAFFGAFVYGCMGTSMWLSVGTEALVSQLYGSILINSGVPREMRDEVAPMLTMYIGIFTAMIIVLRIDKLVDLISPVAISAFTVAGAFLIATSQMKTLVNVHLEPGNPFFGEFVTTYIELFEEFSHWHWPTLVLGVLSISLLVFSKYMFKKYLKNIPDAGPLILVFSSILFSWSLGLSENHGIAIVGEQQSGFPPFKLPWMNVDSELQMYFLREAASLSLISFLIMVSLSRAFGEKAGIEPIIFQEGTALATINLVGCFFGTFSATGSFSGSSVIASLGARSFLPQIINALVILTIMFTLTGVIEWLPKVTLSAIILVALSHMITFKTPTKLWRVSKFETGLWVFVFLGTLFTSIPVGVYASIFLSLVILVWSVVSGSVTEIGPLFVGSTIYRAFERFPDAKRVPGMIIMRIDSNLTFANSKNIEKALESQISKTEMIVLNCEAVNMIDTTAVAMLRKFSSLCESKNIELYFSGWKMQPRRLLHAFRTDALLTGGVLEHVLTPGRWYLNLHDCVIRFVGDIKYEDRVNNMRIIEVNENGENYQWTAANC